MTKPRATLKGRGPEFFGKGIDLLFGDESAQTAAPVADQSPIADTKLAGEAAPVTRQSEMLREEGAAAANDLTAVASQPISGDGQRDSSSDPNAYLRAAAQAFMGAQVATASLASPQDAPQATPWTPSQAGDTFQQVANPDAMQLDMPPLPESGAPIDLPQTLGSPELMEAATAAAPATPAVAPATESLQLSASPQAIPAPAAQLEALFEPQMEPVMPQQPVAPQQSAPAEIRDQPGEPIPAPAQEQVSPRKVGAPDMSAPGLEAIELRKEILDRPREELSKGEAREIQSRLKKSDLAKLDQEVDSLYEKTVAIASGEKEANIAFEALRRARQMLLKEPEQFAEAEYLVQQVRSMLRRVEQSNTWGAYYGPRLLAYQLVCLVAFGFLAWISIIPNNVFLSWLTMVLNVQAGTPSYNMAMLLLSTLAWGAIGGVTSALWSLHYHISLARDYDRVENLWYLAQPLMGMVLGGIVFLIMSAGFLVVNVDLSNQDTALGAKLLPAAIALVVGFRQSVVLDLIDRIVKLVAPGPDEKGPTQPTI